MYKLIALDMDGTLLREDKTVSDKTKKALNDARAKGVKVVLSSGRPIEGLYKYLEELDLIKDGEYVLSYNGSLVQEVKSKNIIASKTLLGKDLKELTELSEKLGVFIHAFSKIEGLITNKMNEYTQLEADLNGIKILERSFDDIEDNEEMIKIMMIDSKENIDKAIENLPESVKEKYTVVRSAPVFLEFLNKESNKGTGLEALVKHMGISRDEVIAVGDAGNDLHMIEYAGLGVAMGNAFDEVKEIANHITKTNEEDGVEAVISKFILS